MYTTFLEKMIGHVVVVIELVDDIVVDQDLEN